MGIINLVKYDGRTTAGERATAKVWLGLATATDDEFQELATFEHSLLEDGKPIAERIEHLKTVRAKIKQEGIKKSELEGWNVAKTG